MSIDPCHVPFERFAVGKRRRLVCQSTTHTKAKRLSDKASDNLTNTFMRQPLRWKKLGLVWKPNGTIPGALSHGMGPTPLILENGTLRVYVTCLDEQGRGRPSWVDLDPDDPTRVVGESAAPVLDIGLPGTFDDNGVMVCSAIIPSSGAVFLYYAGFELCHHIRYRILTGMAISKDGGTSFERFADTPILERCEGELFFRGGPFVLRENNQYLMTYVGGDRWTTLNGKSMPVYDVRTLVSSDGKSWQGPGRVVLRADGPDEHGLGRPWIVRSSATDYKMYLSVRRRSFAAYRLGLAYSANGYDWARKDEDMGLDVTEGGFDAEAIMYGAVIEVHGRTYCFYNGDGFGKQGFGVAVLEE